MDSTTTFDSTKESLHDLLRSIQAGKTQLPDFQRGWVWDDAHVRSLLASISMSFPIGAVMMLETGNPDMRLKPRPVEGADLPRPTEPERLILDGQQRLTSLFQALLSGRAVATRDARGKSIRRWYYIDIARAICPNGDREEAIVGIPEDRLIRNFRNEVLDDYSTIPKECAAGLLPLPLVFDNAGLLTWQMCYLGGDPTNIQERLARWQELLGSIVQRFQQYQVPLILLRKQTPKEAVCQVFEKVNTGGVSLTVFELLTATYAADDYNLREDWDGRLARIRRHKVLEGIESNDFLQAVALLATRERRTGSIDSGTPPESAPGISCKRKEILRLTLTDYRAWADPVPRGFEKAAKLLFGLKLFAARDIPYRTQLTPLAAILAVWANERTPTARGPSWRVGIGAASSANFTAEPSRPVSRGTCQKSSTGCKGARTLDDHRRQLLSRTPPDAPDPQQRRVQGALRPADRGGRARLPHRGDDQSAGLLR